jgi:2-hydroxy-4-carboxymuconate semialdehyde hemiacetal dehydrogenase
VDVSMNGIELQDREFFAAIVEGREPLASVAQVLPCYRVLDGLERDLQTQPNERLDQGSARGEN